MAGRLVFNSGLLRFLALFFATILSGCSRVDAQTSEVVMCPGASVTVSIEDTSFSIKAPGLLTRKIETNHASRLVTLMPMSERSFGSLGLYNPAAGDSQNHITVQEGLQHFSSVEEAREWLNSKERELPIVFTSDGLVVAGRYQNRPSNVSEGPPAAMTIEVWLILVNGVRPTNLAGAHDESFREISLPPRTCTKPIPFTASAPRVINGRKYSGRVIDIMNERGIKGADVERLIRTGERYDENGRISFQPKSSQDESDPRALYFVTIGTDGSVVEIG
jgi:hypothetical protein